jgi:hypothetical protein
LSQGGTDRRHLQICLTRKKDRTQNKTKQNKAKPQKKKEKKSRKRFCKTTTTTKTRKSSSATTIMIQTPNLLIASKSHLIMIAVL